MRQRSKDAGFRAGFTGREFDLGGIAQHDQEQKGSCGERGQGETPIEPEHQRGHANQQETIADEDDDAVGKHILNGVRVGSEASDQISERLAVVEAQRQTLQMSKKMAAQIESKALTNVAKRARKEVRESASSERNEESCCTSAPKDVYGIVRGSIEPGANERDAAGAMTKHTIDDHFERPRAHHGEPGVQNHGHHRGKQSSAIRPQERKETFPVTERAFGLSSAVAARGPAKQGAPRSPESSRSHAEA